MRSKEITNKWKSANNGTRTLKESFLVPEVDAAISDWINHSNLVGRVVLIGGLALSYWTTPRYTQDIDLLFLTDNDIPDTVVKFRRNRGHSFEHIKTGVEVEVLSPEFLGLSPDLVQHIIKNSVLKDGILVADPSGLVALKLQRGSRQDQADIESLVNSQTINMNQYLKYLTSTQIDLFNSIANQE